MARVVFTRAARDDLRGIRDYLAHDSPGTARAVARRIRTESEQLARHPEMGRTVPEYGDPGIRELIVAPYRLIYRFQREQNLVEVIAVIHGSRLLPPLQDI